MTEGVAPIIVTATFGPEDFSWFDQLRRTYFPPERNQLDAHLTLFHALPPSAASELNQRLRQLTARAPLEAIASGLINLGRGVAIRVTSPELMALRTELAEAFHGCLTPQDSNGFRPHVTIQNKVPPANARALLQELSAGFSPRTTPIRGLASFWYRGGPWELLRSYPFRR